MEHAGHGDLLEFVKLRGALTDDNAKVLFKQIARAIEYLHNVGIVHRYGCFYGSYIHPLPIDMLNNER